MVKIRPTTPGRKADASASLEDLARTLARWSREIGSEPPAYVLAALGELQDALGTEDEEPEVTRPAALDAGLETDSELSRSKTRGRHDEKRVRGGSRYVFERGRILTKIPPTPEEDEEATRALLFTLASCYSDALGDAVLAAKAPRCLYPGANVQAAYLALTGREWGSPRWPEDLTGILELDARHREEDRLRALNGLEPLDRLPGLRGRPGHHNPALFGAASGVEIVAYLRARSDLPPEVTPEVVEALREQISLGGGGPTRKKTAAKAVADLEKKLRGNS